MNNARPAIHLNGQLDVLRQHDTFGIKQLNNHICSRDTIRRQVVSSNPDQNLARWGGKTFKEGGERLWCDPCLPFSKK